MIPRYIILIISYLETLAISTKKVKVVVDKETYFLLKVILLGTTLEIKSVKT